MPFKFNPFTGNFDQTGSGGGGSSYLDGEVQNFSALPQTVGSPAVDSAYLVREAEGAWLLNRKPAGIYIRTANTGTRANDWTYAGEFPDVFNDANLVVYNNTDSTKNVKFDASAIATGTTRTLTVPDASGTIQLTGHAASHASSGSDPLFDQDLNTTDSVEFAGIITPSVLYPDANGTGFSIENGELYENGNVAAVWAGLEFAIEKPLGFSGPNAATDISTTRTNLGLGTAATAATGDFAAASHTHELTALAATGATNGHVLTANGSNGATFAALPASGVTGAASSASDVLGVSGANITGVDAGSADRLVFWDDSASKLAYLEAGSGLSISGTTMTVTATGGATNLWIPASAWIPRTTGGCGVDSREIGATNRTNVDELLFDTGTEEFAQALVVMPSNYNNSTITARFYWTAASGSGGVAWGISGRAYGDDDALDQASGTRIVVTDTFIAANDVHVTSATSAVTIAGTPAANKAVNFQISREVGNGSDTLGVDARLLGVEIIFN